MVVNNMSLIGTGLLLIAYAPEATLRAVGSLDSYSTPSSTGNQASQNSGIAQNIASAPYQLRNSGTQPSSTQQQAGSGTFYPGAYNMYSNYPQAYQYGDYPQGQSQNTQPTSQPFTSGRGSDTSRSIIIDGVPIPGNSGTLSQTAQPLSNTASSMQNSFSGTTRTTVTNGVPVVESFSTSSQRGQPSINMASTLRTISPETTQTTSDNELSGVDNVKSWDVTQATADSPVTLRNSVSSPSGGNVVYRQSDLGYIKTPSSTTNSAPTLRNTAFIPNSNATSGEQPTSVVLNAHPDTASKETMSASQYPQPNSASGGNVVDRQQDAGYPTAPSTSTNSVPTLRNTASVPSSSFFGEQPVSEVMNSSPVITSKDTTSANQDSQPDSIIRTSRTEGYTSSGPVITTQRVTTSNSQSLGVKTAPLNLLAGKNQIPDFGFVNHQNIDGQRRKIVYTTDSNGNIVTYDEAVVQ